MTVAHHDLAHEFPEFKDAIHELKTTNNHFRKLFDEYHQITRDVENMQNEATPVSTQVEEEAKIHRLKLKDELYKMLSEETV